MIRPLFLLALGFGSAFGVAWSARAEDTPPTADIKPAAEPLSEGKIKELVEQLDAPKFGDRQLASQKLAEAGAQAMPALADAAINGTREMTVRAIDILKSHFHGGDPALKKSAEASLKQVVDGESPAAASRAKDAMAPKPQPGEAQPQFGPAAGGIRVFNGNAQIQIQVQAIGGNGARKISMKNNNGVKEIEAEENNRKIKINDDPNQGIKIEITETKDGKETTRKVEAKDADDLKKKDADAFKDYEKYSKGNGGIQINGLQIQGGALPIPIQPGQIRPFPVQRAPIQIRKGMEEHIKRLEEQLEKAKEGDLPEEAKELRAKALERIIKSLKEQVERLPVEEEKPADKPAEGKAADPKPAAKPVEIEVKPLPIEIKPIQIEVQPIEIEAGEIEIEIKP